MSALHMFSEVLIKRDVALGLADAMIEQVIIDCISKVYLIIYPLQHELY